MYTRYHPKASGDHPQAFGNTRQSGLWWASSPGKVSRNITKVPHRAHTVRQHPLEQRQLPAVSGDCCQFAGHNDRDMGKDMDGFGSTEPAILARAPTRPVHGPQGAWAVPVQQKGPPSAWFSKVGEGTQDDAGVRGKTIQRPVLQSGAPPVNPHCLLHGLVLGIVGCLRRAYPLISGPLIQGTRGVSTALMWEVQAPPPISLFKLNRHPLFRYSN